MALRRDSYTPELKDLADVIVHWRFHPVDFVMDVFGATPDVWQSQALETINVHDRLSIRSGHGIGKSALMAWVILWWMVTRTECKVACTAPTSHQLNDVLWGELDKWWKKAPQALQPLLSITSDRVIKQTDPKNSYATARTARKENPEALQGFHSPNMLFVVDEASGVEDIIFQVGEGSLSTKGAKILMAGNPTRTSGYFYDSHHKMRHVWKTMRVSCEDATMVDELFISNMKAQYGEDSNVYRVRVLGEFPKDEDSSVIPLSLVEAAIARDIVPVAGKVIWGLDVARFGDDVSALAKRERNHLLEPIKSWKGLDLMATAGRVLDEYERAKKVPDVILVDSIGVGAGVVDRLRELGLPVRGINVAESSAQREKFVRLRDELWWRGREWFETGEALMLDDSSLISELVSVHYNLESNGKIKVESKPDMKKRGLASPNKADAFLLTFATTDFKGSNAPIKYSNKGIV